MNKDKTLFVFDEKEKSELMKFISPFLKTAIIVTLVICTAEPAFLKVGIVRMALHTTVIAYILYEISTLFLKFVVKNEQMKSSLKNLLLMGYTLLITLGFIEIVFTFIPLAHGATVLSTQNWFYYFWKNNDLGYRDSPYSEKEILKKKIFFIGDSFTAGHGISYPKDRFSDIVGQKLKGDFEFYNLGVNGASPESEYAELLAHPYQPDIIIWQYYGNDIIPNAMESGKPLVFDPPYRDINRLQEVLIRGSYLFNYLYWKFPTQKKKSDNDHRKYLLEAYGNPVIWSEHLKDLEKFVKYSQEKKIPMIVVIFPLLENFEASQVYISPLIDYLKVNHIPAIDVSDLAAHLSFEERVVNLHNLHPGVKLNQLVAQAIYQRLIHENIISNE